MNACRVVRSIVNLQYPKCVDCTYFVLDKPIIRGLSRCYRFGTSNLVTGKINYEYADICRNDPMKCGVIGTHFIKAPGNWVSRYGL
jgi:hypothetical protein